MSFRTYDEEKRSALIDEATEEVGHLVLLMLKARTEEQLAELATPTSALIRKGTVQIINHHLPRIEDLRRQITAVQETLAKLDTELIDVGTRVRDLITENAQREYDKQHPGVREDWTRPRSLYDPASVVAERSDKQ